jgi:hypothetical protein
MYVENLSVPDCTPGPGGLRNETDGEEAPARHSNLPLLLLCYCLLLSSLRVRYGTSSVKYSTRAGWGSGWLPLTYTL